MYIWPLIIITLLLQESASTAAVFVVVLQNHVSLWPLHIIWLAATFVDMLVGFSLGVFLRKKIKTARFVTSFERWRNTIKRWFGGYGESLSLGLLAIVNFPYLNAFLGGWLGIPRSVTLLSTFIGNFVWYLLVWGAVLGLSSFIRNPEILLFIIIGIGILANFVLKPARSRSAQNGRERK